MDIDNPYQAPTARIEDPTNTAGNLENIRQDHIRHEVQIQSIGSLYVLGGIVLGLSSFAMLTAVTSDGNSQAHSPMLLAMLVVYGVLTIAMFALAYGYRKLMPWVKIPGTLLSAIGLLAFPIGTLINGYILYLIWCKPGRIVLGKEYRDIVRVTSHVKYKRTLGDKIAVAILIALLAGGGLLLLATIYK